MSGSHAIERFDTDSVVGSPASGTDESAVRQVASTRVSIPIQDILLPGSRRPVWKGLVVVIGPNSAGKTQLLKDINATVCGEARQLVVATKIALTHIADVDEFVEALVERGDLLRGFDAQGNPTIQRRSGQLGAANMGTGSTINLTDFKHRYQSQYAPRAGNLGDSRIPSDAFLSEVGGLLCTSLFLHNRLTMANETDSFDYEKAPPSNTIQSLYLSQRSQELLTREIISTFQRALWLDNTRGGRLCFRVAATATIPPEAELRQPEAMRCHRLLDDEGDGLRSYVATCMSLLVGQRPLCIIDEPELCLHPPQAHAIGRFIGQYGKSEERCTVVATHSSYVLRGIISVHPAVQIIRLIRDGDQFAASVLESTALSAAISKPLSRSESILDGLLSDGVILCESEGDRIVYESVVRGLSIAKDFRVVSATSGLGAMPATCQMYRALGVPIAVVADIDVIGKAGELGAILRALGMEEEQVRLCMAASGRIALNVAAAPLEVTRDEVARVLDVLTSRLRDERVESGLDVRAELRRIDRQLAPSRELKRRGRDALSPTDQGDFDTINALARTCGLFLVPVGELESWLSDLGLSPASAVGKPTWAISAAVAIEDSLPRKDDVWKFTNEVVTYLSEQVSRAVEVAHTADSSAHLHA